MMLHRATKDSINVTPFIAIHDINSSSMSYQQNSNRGKVCLRLNTEDAKSMADGIYKLLSLNDKVYDLMY